MKVVFGVLGAAFSFVALAAFIVAILLITGPILDASAWEAFVVRAIPSAVFVVATILSAVFFKKMLK